MTRLVIAFFAAMFLGSPLHAFSAESGFVDGLEFVAETRIPGPQGGDTLALCHMTRDLRLLGYTLNSSITGYALAADACTQKAERALTAVEMETAQTLRLIDPTLPTVPVNTLERALSGYAVWVAISLALIAVIIRRIKSLLGRDLRPPMRRKARDRIVTVMCYVGKCDGTVPADEIGLISKTAQRLTRRTVKAKEVSDITDQIKFNLTPRDFINFGKGLRDKEKDIMMQAAFYVALARGQMLPVEHQFVTKLAEGVGMPGEHFRRVMNLTLADLDLHPPANL